MARTLAKASGACDASAVRRDKVRLHAAVLCRTSAAEVLDLVGRVEGDGADRDDGGRRSLGVGLVRDAAARCAEVQHAAIPEVVAEVAEEEHVELYGRRLPQVVADDDVDLQVARCEVLPEAGFDRQRHGRRVGCLVRTAAQVVGTLFANEDVVVVGRRAPGIVPDEDRREVAARWQHHAVEL